jgi:cell shape-determining protein MreC
LLNDKVIYGSLVIGNIVEVGDGYSKAKLFSSPGNVFSGTLGEDDIKVEVKGIGGGGFYALVPIGSKSEVGDALIMPNISSKVYGVVQRVEELTAEGFKKLYFVMPINPNQIREVLIER